MNRRSILKIFVLVIFIIFVINATITYASSLEDVILGGKGFIASGSAESAIALEKDKLQDTSNSIYNILLIVSFVVVAVIGIILGIKYMMAGVEDKAQVKNSLVVFFIGCIVVYGSFGIWRVLVKFLNTI